jgi:hypothetical protein
MAERAILLPAVTALAALGGCVSASAVDETRGGIPVVAATLEQVDTNPTPWDGKWVRIEGWFDFDTPRTTASLKSDPSTWNGDVDGYRSVELLSPHGAWPAALDEKPVMISGKLDARCFAANEHRRRIAEANPGSLALDTWFGGSWSICNGMQGRNTFLTDVIVEPAETIQ